jgi:hypothetical protein
MPTALKKGPEAALFKTVSMLSSVPVEKNLHFQENVNTCEEYLKNFSII